ncbi:SMT3 Ubiquitin-like protein SMT3 [Candida maltosa Xu316]
MSDNEAPGSSIEPTSAVSDGTNEVFFKIKRNTKFSKVIDAYCKRQGYSVAQKRFFIDGTRVDAEQTPEDLDLEDGDIMEVHNAQQGGC